MYQKNIILITSIFLLFGCMDKTKLNNDADAASIEKRAIMHPLRASPSRRTPMVNTFCSKDHFLIFKKKRLTKLISPMAVIG